jgi:hypothetical protein
MKIELGMYYLTKTNGAYYSDWLVRTIDRHANGDFICLIIKGKDIPSVALHLPFASHELCEISPVMQALYGS